MSGPAEGGGGPELPIGPDRGLVGALRRLLLAALPDDDWSAEFVHELDAAYRAARDRRGPSPKLWYVCQVLAPRTLRFVWMMRRRRRGMSEQTLVARTSGLGDAWLDVGHAWRGIVREPRTAVFIALTLALGIGSVSAMYGVAERLFLSGPRHVASPETLVRVYLDFEDELPGLNRTSPWIPFLTAGAIKDASPSLSGMTLYRFSEQLGRVGSGVRPLRLSEVDADYFDVLGVRPLVGGFFGDGAADGEGGPVVLAHHVAVEGLGTPAEALGRTVELGDVSKVVVGVAPDGFAGPHLERVDAWIPIDRERAGNRNWWVVARLPSADASARQTARVQADAIHQRTDPGRAFQWARSGSIIMADLGSDDTARAPAESRVAALLLGVVGMVLLIACANVVNLLLARLTRRQGEIVVRLALGIGRGRLARLLMAESLLLAGAGALLSLPVAHVGGLVLRGTLLPDVAWTASPLDARVLAATVAAAFATGLLVGLLPIRHAGATNLSSGLSSTRHSPGAGRARTQATLATVQVALSAALLMCAGLFLKSFWVIRVTDLGVRPDVLTVELLSLDETALREGSEGESEAYRRALEAVRGVAGVEDAALTVGLPFWSNFGMSIWVPGFDSIPELPGGGPFVNAVGAGYFAAVGTSIVRGSPVTEEHVANGERVAVVSRTMAETLWPNRTGLGECVRRGRADTDCYRVVGVAADVHRQGYREPPSMQFYIPLGTQDGFSGTLMVVRAGGDSPALVERVRAALLDIDPLVEHVRVERLDALLEPQVRPWRLGAVVLSLTGLVAALVSLLGVYGVLSYMVAQRRHEIGVRIALGASSTAIRQNVVGRGLAWGAVGVVSGIGLVVAGSRWLGPLLFETRVTDPVVITAVATLLLGSVVAACLLPASHASRVDPAASLRGVGLWGSRTVDRRQPG